MSGYQQGPQQPYGAPGQPRPGTFQSGGAPFPGGQQQPRPGGPGGPRPMGGPPAMNGPQGPRGPPAPGGNFRPGPAQPGPMQSGPVRPGPPGGLLVRPGGPPGQPGPMRPGGVPGQPMRPVGSPGQPMRPPGPGQPGPMPGGPMPGGPRPGGPRPGFGAPGMNGPPAPGMGVPRPGMPTSTLGAPRPGGPMPARGPSSTPGGMPGSMARPGGFGAPAPVRPGMPGPPGPGGRPGSMTGGAPPMPGSTGPPGSAQRPYMSSPGNSRPPSMSGGGAAPPGAPSGQAFPFAPAPRPGLMPPPRPGLAPPPRLGQMQPGVLAPGGPAPAMGPPPPSQPKTPSTRLGGLAAPGQSLGYASSMPSDPVRQQQLVEQMESLALAPEAPGQQDHTDPGLFPRPLDGDGESFPSLDQLLAPEPRSHPQCCDPRIMRCSVAAIPASASLKASWHVPLALTVRPYADFGEPVPLVDGTAPQAIIRCMRCRSYINPFAVWSDGGRKFRCVMCGQLSDVPEEQYVPTDPRTGLRQDVEHRPELTCGTVEYQAPEDYSVRPPMPQTYFFVIDVSQGAVQSGALATICSTIRACLDSLAQESMTRVGFLTYDSTLHFYNLNPALTAPQMMIVADLEDPFPPLPEDHFVTIETGRPAIEKLLDLLPSTFEDTTVTETAMGPALQAAFRTITHMGGKLMLFVSTPPVLGPGKIKHRESPALYNTDREPNLRQPADTFFKEFTGECISNQITVDVFAMSAHYCDLYSLDVLPRYTSGQLYHYPNFTATRDAAKLTAELTRNLTRSTAWEAVMRLRCSQGLRISQFHGHLYVRTNDLLALPTVSEDSAFVAQIQLEESVVEGPLVHIQCALLFTAANSERRIRVHTLALPVVSSLHDMYDKADGIANASVLAKLAVEKSLKSRLDETRDAVDKKLVAQLKEYKALQAGAARGGGRLIYPKSMRMMMPWLLGLMKTSALRGGQDVNCDERCAVASLVLTAPVELLALMAYPALYKLHMGGWGHRNDAGKLVLPQPTPLRSDQMDPAGAYLMDAGNVCFVWLGQQASSQLVEDLFGKEAVQMMQQGNLQEVNMLSIEPARPGSTLAARVGDLLAEKRRSRCVWPDCRTVMQGTQMEAYFAQYLTEDRSHPKQMSYQEYLQSLLKKMSLR